MRLFDWLGGKKKTNLSIAPREASPSTPPQKQQSPAAPAPKHDKPPEKPVATSPPKPQTAPTATPPSGGNAQMIRITVSRGFPQEITKGHSREQVSELIRASARYTWTGIGNWIKRDIPDASTSGVNDPTAASISFEMNVQSSEETRAIEAVHRNWEFLLQEVRGHGGLGGFCEEYRKVTSTRTLFNPHKPICDTCARDLNPCPLFRPGDHYAGYICKPCRKVVCPRCASQYNCPDCGTKLDDAGLKALLDLANAKQAAAHGETLIEALALVFSSFTGEQTKAIEWFDAITSFKEPPPYAFDLVVAEGPKIYKTVLICFFDSSKGTPKPPPDSFRDQFLPWMERAGGGNSWWSDQESYGPQTYPPGTNLKLEGYFGGIQILRQKRIGKQ